MSSPKGSGETNVPASAAIEMLIDGRTRDLGGFSVRRVLPYARRRLVGPFVLFDHAGPLQLSAGVKFDVRPHPHIGLATVTYLFEGEVVHRDSLGSVQAIRPSDVNWMVAGRGVVHSERSPPEARSTGARIHALQSWVALPLEHEELEPRFEHHPSRTIPHLQIDGAELDVIAGTAFGARSPVGVLSPTLYVHAQLPQGARLGIDTEHEERAVYVVAGAASCDAQALNPGNMAVLRAGQPVTIEALAPSRLILLGGATLAGERHIWWNFVASVPERIERAKDAWKNGVFPKVPGDEIEFIPLPES